MEEAPLRDGETWIYFVQAYMPTGELGPIKIGRATNLTGRVCVISGHAPWGVELMHAVRAPREFEREMHRRFGAHHLRGEWFHPVAELVDFIGRLKSGCELPAISHPKCIGCGAELDRGRRGGSTCSRACQGRAQSAPKEIRPCAREGCGAAAKPGRKHCGSSCAKAAAREAAVRLRPRFDRLHCDRCGRDLTAIQHKNGQRFCSKECQDDARALPRHSTCERCGKALSIHATSVTRFCSQTCGARANGEARAKAARHGTPLEVIKGKLATLPSPFGLRHIKDWAGVPRVADELRDLLGQLVQEGLVEVVGTWGDKPNEWRVVSQSMRQCA